MKKENSGLAIFIAIILILLGLVIFTNKTDNNVFSDTNTTNLSNIRYSRNKYIASLKIEGEITEKTKTYNQKWILQTIDDLKNDEKNIAIALFINSPGGSVYESDEVYLKLQNYKKSGKKVYIYQGALAASGGYYISCAGDFIYSNRNTLTGSIGVISGQTFDISNLLEKNGIKSETIHAGKNKNMGNFNEPMTEEQRLILQSIADECYEQFTSIVAETRKIDINTVKKIADGRVYTAKQALELNLIDKIDSWENMIENLKNNLEEPNCEVVELNVPQDNSSIFDILNLLNQTSTNQGFSNIDLPSSIKKQLNSDIKYPAFIYNY